MGPVAPHHGAACTYDLPAAPWRRSRVPRHSLPVPTVPCPAAPALPRPIRTPSPSNSSPPCCAMRSRTIAARAMATTTLRSAASPIWIDPARNRSRCPQPRGAATDGPGLAAKLDRDLLAAYRSSRGAGFRPDQLAVAIMIGAALKDRRGARPRPARCGAAARPLPRPRRGHRTRCHRRAAGGAERARRCDLGQQWPAARRALRDGHGSADRHLLRACPGARRLSAPRDAAGRKSGRTDRPRPPARRSDRRGRQHRRASG